MTVCVGSLLDRHDVNGKAWMPLAIANRTSFSMFNSRQFGSELASSRGASDEEAALGDHLPCSPSLFRN